MDKERSDLFRDFYHSCNRHVDSGIFTFSTFLTTSILENRCIFIICSHYPRDEMFFLSCSRHPSRKFTLVQEWNRPYPMCTYRISNVSLRFVDCDNLEINIIYSTKMKRMMQIINEIIYQNIKRTISFNFTYYIREKELSTEKNYFSWGSIDKDGIHSIGRVYSRNVIFFIYISFIYRFSTRKKGKAYVFFEYFSLQASITEFVSDTKRW